MPVTFWKKCELKRKHDSERVRSHCPSLLPSFKKPLLLLEVFTGLQN